MSLPGAVLHMIACARGGRIRYVVVQTVALTYNNCWGKQLPISRITQCEMATRTRRGMYVDTGRRGFQCGQHVLHAMLSLLVLTLFVRGCLQACRAR